MGKRGVEQFQRVRENKIGTFRIRDGENCDKYDNDYHVHKGMAAILFFRDPKL